MTVYIELYGRLRDAGPRAPVELVLSDSATAADALAALQAAFGADAAALEGAVLATESEILPPDAPVPAEGRLAALPPVCGG